MKPNFPQEGVLAALAIPTDRRGRVLKSALTAHLAWLRHEGVHGVLALGSTGEFPRFSLEERKAILALVAELAAPLPVIANISDIRPQAVAELGRCARRLKLPGVALMPPSFYPMTAADQLEFFARAAESAGLPVLLYNYPELTGNRIAPETVAAFADRAALAGIKQSGGEFDYHRELIALGREKDFVVFSGADTRLPEVFALGAAGCIGGLVNFVPDLMVRLFQICRQGATGDPRPAAERMQEIGGLIGRVSFPLNVAAGLEARGLEPGWPKIALSRESTQRYRELVRVMQARFKSWQLPPARDPRPAPKQAKRVA